MTGEAQGYVPPTEDETNMPSAEALPSLLGFTETSELTQIRSRAIGILVEAGPDNITPEVQQVMSQYHQAAEAVAASMVGTQYKWSQIGIMVGMAQIYADAGWSDAESSEIENAWTMADREGCLDELNNLLISLGYPQ
jgi:hypothetical protein